MENVAAKTALLASPYQYAVASRALAGERHCGDAALVCPGADGVLVAVVDGLGHGEEAAEAAAAAIKSLRQHAGQPVAALLQHCHEALRQTRGVAIALATLEFASQQMAWCGVGNVEGLLIDGGRGSAANKHYLTNGSGVVGYRLPTVRTNIVPVKSGNLLIFATDGIDEGFSLRDIPNGTPEQVARRILEHHGKATDDALVLVLRWLGTRPGKLPGEGDGY